ncbi:MAG TPA: CRISPR-associated protein Cas4 [Bacillota bacterium]|jgi:CRISPR-associated exonuclease Cas4|nr:CRISPR-associated protein Cas4 [Bacillota bacterium]HPT60977.1 CRISPR-associated protein Cas4 [Bacillota bacterium]
MRSEEDLIPISLLSQYYYCKRRAGLMLLERQWQDNIHTAEGTVLHERVHSGKSESRGSFHILRTLTVRSFEVGLVGVIDCLEIVQSENGYALPWLEGRWAMHPVEYKHGVRRNELEYEVQMAAQAMCLEEMYNCKIDKGYVYYGDDRRRIEVTIDDYYRDLVVEGAKSLNKILENQVTPIARRSAKCRECSLNDVCFPKILNKKTSLYIDKIWNQACGVE